MQIVHITNLSNNKSSGLSNIVPLHIEWQSEYSDVKWFNINSTYNKPLDSKCINLNLSRKLNIFNLIINKLNKTDLVIFHGVYFYLYYKIAEELKRRNIKYIIVPHGSLTEISIQKKRLKKFIGFKLFFNSFLNDACAIQYLTEGEYFASGNKWNNNYIIVPNGINIPDKQKNKFNENKMVGTYIGRKDIYYKGLDLLLDACKLIREELYSNNFTINIYGPNNDGENEKLASIISKYQLNGAINVFDEIYDLKKEEVLLRSDFFVLTSRTEGHPVSLIEALSYGIPCLVTKGTNMMNEIINSRAGFGAEISAESIANSIRNLIKEKSKLEEIGSNAFLLSKDYEWSKIAIESLSKYKDLVNK